MIKDDITKQLKHCPNCNKELITTKKTCPDCKKIQLDLGGKVTQLTFKRKNNQHFICSLCERVVDDSVEIFKGKTKIDDSIKYYYICIDCVGDIDWQATDQYWEDGKTVIFKHD